MTARQDILSRKFLDSASGAAAKRAAGSSGQMADVFGSFVGYASANWNYAAQPGGQTAAGLLDGTGPATVACGTIREALKLVLREDLQLKDVQNADINGYFLTKPQLSCFDAKVKGNVGNHGGHSFDLACHFSSHFFLSTGGKFYDPCLVSVYTSDKGPVAHNTRLLAGQGLRKAGLGTALIIVHLLAGRSVPGFGSVWEIVTPQECKKALTAAEFNFVKNDPDVKLGKLL